MKLYNSYCYSDIQAVVSSISSRTDLAGRLIDQVNLSGLNDIVVSFSVGSDYVFTPPDCSLKGFDNSFTGISFQESLDLSWLMVSVLIVAFTFKILRKGL